MRSYNKSKLLIRWCENISNDFFLVVICCNGFNLACLWQNFPPTICRCAHCTLSGVFIIYHFIITMNQNSPFCRSELDPKHTKPLRSELKGIRGTRSQQQCPSNPPVFVYLTFACPTPLSDALEQGGKEVRRGGMG